MSYPEFLIAPMRQELTQLGVRELRTAAEVDESIRETQGTLMIVVNSVCGCAAGKARPGVAVALQHAVKPDVVTTVFAGADVEATERARGYFTGYPPSSPSIALLRDGKLIYIHGAPSDRKPGSPGHRFAVDSGVRHALPEDGSSRLATGRKADQNGLRQRD